MPLEKLIKMWNIYRAGFASWCG